MRSALSRRAMTASHRAPRSASIRWSPAHGAFLVALALRLWVSLQVAGTPYFLPNQGDMKFYSDWARRIAGGAWTDHQAFYGLPGYAFLLGGIYRVVGYQPFLVVLLQTVAEAFTALLIYWIAARCAENGRARPWLVGFAASLAWVFFIPAQAYSSILMPSAFLVLAFWSVVWWIVRARAARPPLWQFAAIGLALGAVAMMVANILFLAPLLLGAIWRRHAWPGWGARPWATRAGAAACLLAGVVAGASPCWLHNRLAAGEPVFLSAHSGINFWLGNHPGANGYPSIPEGLRTDQKGMLMDSIAWAERAEGRPLRRAEVSAFWSAKAHDYIVANPGRWLRLEARKLGNFWNAFQYDDLGVVSSLREDGALLPGFGFGWVAALALPGMALAAWRRPEARWVVGASLLHMASLMTVFITERYRLAAVPGLIVLAAVGAAELRREVSERRWRLPAVYAGIFAAGLFVVCRPVEKRLLGLDEYNAAIGDLDEGRLDRAQQRLERVHRLTPDSAAVNFALGNVWFERGDRDRAKSYYRRTLQLDPRQEHALNNLGVLAMQEERWPLAEAFLSGSLALEPEDDRANFLLAKTRYARHDVAGARLALAESLRLQPGRPEYQALADQLRALP